ncbi:glycosyltransferase family 2 protein [Flavobacterium nackdongense]|uniref:Glycosyltransferase n=1 Tax=Flavobacterium nackdongense TaxID=2547394 RepID=A0A4V1AGZ9_9FLAO|nr:glycosyltransferase family 2 protein [Flavobacterium nackdongense]QBN19802.1 glycosyltransferase [Flavobacterium nackdongense]
MKISIITVCYNSEQHIASAIASVLSQTYNDIEYIIVDGCSTDTTLHIIKEFEPQFNGRLKWISEKDSGLYDAMNKGVKMATGEVIGLINSDDLFCDTLAIEKVMKIFSTDITLDSVYADLYYVSQTDTDKIVRRWVTGKQKPFKNGWHPAHPTFYIKKEVYDSGGYFNLDFKLAADFEIMLRFLERYHISAYYLADPLVKMRLGGETNKSLKNIYNQNIECIKAFTVNQIQVNKLLYPLYRTIPKLLQFK